MSFNYTYDIFILQGVIEVPNNTIIDILNSIREELIRANDLKEVELGIKSDVEYKAEQSIIKKRKLELDRKKECQK